MSRLQKFRFLLQDCFDGCGKVSSCSEYKTFFLVFAAYPKEKHRVLKLPRIHKAISCLVFVLFFLIVTSIHTSAQEKSRLLKDDPKAPWHIVADEIHYDDTINKYIAKGNVTITKQDKNLSADYVHHDRWTRYTDRKPYGNGSEC